MSASASAFAIVAALFHARSGIRLSPDKAYLLDSRLAAVARRHGHADVDALAAALARPSPGALADEVVEAMLNHETLFFRDRAPFDTLRDVTLPALRAARAATRRLRIWSAAASTGQEPYSIAMTIAADPAAWRGWTVEIVATDLSRHALARAAAGHYSQFEIQRGLPIQLLLRHFAQDATGWQLDDRIRAMVDFRSHDLCRPVDALGRFDVIFCRNVLMYFDPATKRDVLARIRRQLSPDGALVLGAAEAAIGMEEDAPRLRAARA